MNNNRGRIINCSFEHLLKDVSIGILILDSKNNNSVFQNNFFKELAGEYAEFIINHIMEHICKKRLKVHNEIEVKNDLIFGFSVYPAKQIKEHFCVLISDISSEKIYLDAKCRKSYYNRLSQYSMEIAHEVGNPLTSVIMTLQVLSKNLLNWKQEQQKEYIDTSIMELKRLSNFMKRIRDFSKKYNLELKAISLEEIINRVVIQNQIRLNKKNIKIFKNIDKKIIINVDEDVFYQIIFNLIQNAIEISDNISMIRFEVDEIDDYFVKFVYFNNGPYIKSTILEKIFLPNFSTKEGGNGIGLDLSLKLMTNMGGTIKAENCKNKQGVKFILFVPIPVVGAKLIR